MSGVFRKLLSRELGKNRYENYFYYYQRKIATGQYEDGGKMDQEEIYQDIRRTLADNDKAVLEAREERMMEALMTALRISKTYIFALAIYLLGVVLVATRPLPLWIIAVSVGLMSVFMALKTYEYIINKYCFIDAHILLIYQKVLQELLLCKEQELG